MNWTDRYFLFEAAHFIPNILRANYWLKIDTGYRLWMLQFPKMWSQMNGNKHFFYYFFIKRSNISSFFSVSCYTIFSHNNTADA